MPNLTDHLPVIAAALTDYEYALSAFYDGLLDALRDAKQARAALLAVREAMQPQAVNAEGLLPCPFCGGNAYLRYTCPDMDTYDIGCDNGCVRMEDFRFDGEAIAAWNRREAMQQPAAPSVLQADWASLPKSIKWWCVAAHGGVQVSSDDEPVLQAGWAGWIYAHGLLDGGGLPVRVDIPIGIDWRLLKEKRPAPGQEAK